MVEHQRVCMDYALTDGQMVWKKEELVSLIGLEVGLGVDVDMP